MKFCKKCIMTFVENQERKYIMNHDFNGKPCQRPISSFEDCNNKSEYTIIMKPTSLNKGNEKK